jgi:RND family efflux transporter MFP subunit
MKQLVVGLFFFSVTTTFAQQSPNNPLELAQADVSQVVRQSIANEVRISGTLTPIRRATLTSRVSSTILELPVQIGDVVKAGDLLVRFDADALSSAVTARRAEIDALGADSELAAAALKRSTTLLERGAASEATRLEAQAKVLSLQAQIRSKQAELADAERALEYTEVRAGFDGIVAARPVEPGQTVAMNTNLITIVDLTRMEVDAGVPTSRIPLVRLKQPVELEVEGFTGRRFAGEVVRISPTAVAGSRAVRVFVAIDNKDHVLRGGMFTTGILRVDEQPDVTALPSAAIRSDAGGTFVLRVSDGILVRAAVQPGMSWPDRDQIAVTGVEEGDVVVTAPLTDLAAGNHVTVAGH